MGTASPGPRAAEPPAARRQDATCRAKQQHDMCCDNVSPPHSCTQIPPQRQQGNTLWPGEAASGTQRPGPASVVQQLVLQVGRSRAARVAKRELHACRTHDTA